MNTQTTTPPKIQWASELEVGHPEIDGDHRAMIAMLSRIEVASLRRDQDEVMAVLRELEAFTRSHFAREERLMAEIRYEFMARHRKEHLSLFDEIREQTNDLLAGSTDATEIARFVRRWMLDHVAAADRPLGLALARFQRR